VKPVTTEDHGAARHVVMSRPDRRNALDGMLVQALAMELRLAADEPEIECVVLRGKGPSFCAGIDISTLRELADGSRLRAVRADFVAVADLLEQMPKPTVAQIQGWCVGAGFELALACDLRVVSADAVLGLPETRIGAVPDVGGLARLGALVGAGRAKELVLTSALVDGERAARLGIANRVSPTREELDAATATLVDEVLTCSALANGLAKRVIDAATKPALAATLEQELTAQLVCIESDRFRAGVDAFDAYLNSGVRGVPGPSGTRDGPLG